MLKLKSHNLILAIVIGLTAGLMSAMARAEIVDSGVSAPTQAPATAETKVDTSSLDSPGTNATVGSLPDSKQWLYDRTSSYIYLSYDTVDLRAPTINISHFTTDLGTTSFKYFALDSFTRLITLANPEGTSFFRRFAIWGDVALGMGSHDGDLYDNDIKQSMPAESSTLTVFFGKVGAQLVYDDLTWLKPYVGYASTWFSFRNSSSMSGAVAEGGSAFYGPTVGVHVPLTFLGKVSAYGEWQQASAQRSSGQLFADGSNLNGGVGYSF